ncbi:hypothetical protein FQR65_LT00622 [Abscondita terminalis]|nr:hypothetical protein FQR65_LT00622 [Abscondita terminalis]
MNPVTTLSDCTKINTLTDYTSPRSIGRALPRKLNFGDDCNGSPVTTKGKKKFKRRINFDEACSDKENDYGSETTDSQGDRAEIDLKKLPAELDHLQLKAIIDLKYYNWSISNLMDMYQVNGTDTFDD